jgi:hypothetical protein
VTRIGPTIGRACATTIVPIAARGTPRPFDLTVLVEAVGSEFVVLRSPETAEHDPDYREVGRFPTREKALQFLAADG